MTPAEHIAQAKKSVVHAEMLRAGRLFEQEHNELLTAIAHALIAHAVEGGVPYVPQAEQPPQS